MSEEKFRLVTRSDFDGLVCAVLLKELGLTDDILFVHPKDMQDGSVDITSRDITTNLPYAAGAHLVFDHHHSETLRVGARDNHIIDASAPSAARVVYNYYGGKAKFPHISEEMMHAVDKADSADFNEQEILEPQGWVLLNYLMDSRTGLGRFRDFRVSNYQLMMQLIDYCRDHTVEEILALPDVDERVKLYQEQSVKFEAQLKRCSTVSDKLVVLDLREEETIWAGNRFAIYALHPECSISIHCIWGRQKQNTVFAVGKSILDKSCTTNVGELMLKFGGGGHHAAGTCQIDTPDAELALEHIKEQILTDERVARVAQAVRGRVPVPEAARKSA